jgi:MFS family permease
MNHHASDKLAGLLYGSFIADALALSARGVAVPLGAGAQAVTRFFADPFVERYSPTAVSRVLLGVLGVGVLLVFFAPSDWLALIGFALMGVGTSVVFPLAMSAAAQLTDGPAPTHVASLAQISFVAFLLGSPLLGYVAEHFGIRWSFGVGLPLVILSFVCCRSAGDETDEARGRVGGRPRELILTCVSRL